MRVTVLGKRWQLKYCTNLGDARGKCDPPDSANKTIRILAGQQPQLELDTLIHELIHAGDWHRDEECVTQLATDIAAALWKLGYRKV